MHSSIKRIRASCQAKWQSLQTPERNVIIQRRGSIMSGRWIKRWLFWKRSRVREPLRIRDVVKKTSTERAAVFRLLSTLETRSPRCYPAGLASGPLGDQVEDIIFAGIADLMKAVGRLASDSHRTQRDPCPYRDPVMSESSIVLNNTHGRPQGAIGVKTTLSAESQPKCSPGSASVELQTRRILPRTSVMFKGKQTRE